MTYQISTQRAAELQTVKTARGWLYASDLTPAEQVNVECERCGGAFKYGSSIAVTPGGIVRHRGTCIQPADFRERQSAPQAGAQRHTWRYEDWRFAR